MKSVNHVDACTLAASRAALPMARRAAFTREPLQLIVLRGVIVTPPVDDMVIKAVITDNLPPLELPACRVFFSNGPEGLQGDFFFAPRARTLLFSRGTLLFSRGFDARASLSVEMFLGALRAINIILEENFAAHVVVFANDLEIVKMLALFTLTACSKLGIVGKN